MEFLKGKEYSVRLPLPIKTNPLFTFEEWFRRAQRKEPNPTAMCVSNVVGGLPRSRMMLLKHFGEHGFFFCTNYQKLERSDSGVWTAVFYWDSMDAQVIITGRVRKAPEWMSNDYWDTRSRFAKLVSICSQQSEEMNGAYSFVWDMLRNASMERPEHWGGLLLDPFRYEFWQGGSCRQNRRTQYDQLKGVWTQKQLQP